MRELWNGFVLNHFLFEGYEARMVFPHKSLKRKCLALKMEYWDAFPEVEKQLVSAGFHLAWLENETRFATETDCDRKARFLAHLKECYDSDFVCILIGYSCGGAHAVNFAGTYPELVSGIYLDAPVLNFCSYPGKLGNKDCEQVWKDEFVQAYPQTDRWQLLNFDAHPICKSGVLVQKEIPILLVYGAEDQLVPYEENGKLLEMAYADTDAMTVLRIPFRGHHPHGALLETENGMIVEHLLRMVERK